MQEFFGKERGGCTPNLPLQTAPQAQFVPAGEPPTVCLNRHRSRRNNPGIGAYQVSMYLAVPTSMPTSAHWDNTANLLVVACGQQVNCTFWWLSMLET